MKIRRQLLLGLLLYALVAAGTTWSPRVEFYPEAHWNGRVFVPTGRIKAVCNDSEWICDIAEWAFPENFAQPKRP